MANGTWRQTFIEFQIHEPLHILGCELPKLNVAKHRIEMTSDLPGVVFERAWSRPYPHDLL